MVTWIFVASVLLAVANWILIPFSMKRHPKVTLSFYTPTAVVFSLFSVIWALQFGDHIR